MAAAEIEGIGACNSMRVGREASLDGQGGGAALNRSASSFLAHCAPRIPEHEGCGVRGASCSEEAAGGSCGGSGTAGRQAGCRLVGLGGRGSMQSTACGSMARAGLRQKDYGGLERGEGDRWTQGDGSESNGGSLEATAVRKAMSDAEKGMGLTLYARSEAASAIAVGKPVLGGSGASGGGKSRSATCDAMLSGPGRWSAGWRHREQSWLRL